MQPPIKDHIFLLLKKFLQVPIRHLCLIVAKRGKFHATRWTCNYFLLQIHKNWHIIWSQGARFLCIRDARQTSQKSWRHVAGAFPSYSFPSPSGACYWWLLSRRFAVLFQRCEQDVYSYSSSEMLECSLALPGTQWTARTAKNRVILQKLGGISVGISSKMTVLWVIVFSIKYCKCEES